MPKSLILIIASLITILAFVVQYLSFGWYLMVFLVLLIPAMCIHILALIKAVKYVPKYFGVIFSSSITFFMFSLLRPDEDTIGNYTGYSSLLFAFDISDEPYIEVWHLSLEITMLLLLMMIFQDLFLLVKAGKAKKQRDRPV